MKKWNDWIRTWTVPQALVVGFGMACVTAMSITITLHDDWGRLVRWLAQPEAMALVGGIVLWVVGLYHRALKTPVTLLLLLALAVPVSGCGASAVTMGARGTETAERLLAPTMTWAHDARAHQLDVCGDAACLDAGEAEWAPFVAALNAARDACAAILDALDLVHAHDANAPTEEQIFALARTALDTWTTARDVAATFRRTLPALPDEVTALIGGAS